MVHIPSILNCSVARFGDAVGGFFGVNILLILTVYNPSRNSLKGRTGAL